VLRRADRPARGDHGELAAVLWAPGRQRWRASCRKLPSLRRLILKPRKIAVKGARYRSRR